MKAQDTVTRSWPLWREGHRGKRQEFDKLREEAPDIKSYFNSNSKCSEVTLLTIMMKRWTKSSLLTMKLLFKHYWSQVKPFRYDWRDLHSEKQYHLSAWVGFWSVAAISIKRPAFLTEGFAAELRLQRFTENREQSF